MMILRFFTQQNFYDFLGNGPSNIYDVCMRHSILSICAIHIFQNVRICHDVYVLNRLAPQPIEDIQGYIFLPIMAYFGPFLHPLGYYTYSTPLNDFPFP